MIPINAIKKSNILIIYIQEFFKQSSLYTFKVKEFIFDDENFELAILKLSLPINFLSELSKTNFSIASANFLESFIGTKNPLCPSITTSLHPTVSVATNGKEAAAPSTRTLKSLSVGGQA